MVNDKLRVAFPPSFLCTSKSQWVRVSSARDVKGGPFCKLFSAPINYRLKKIWKKNRKREAGRLMIHEILLVKEKRLSGLYSGNSV